MKDPWLVVDPIKDAQRTGVNHPDPDKPAKINHAGERDMDADWQPHRSCFLRFKMCTFEICGPDLQTPRDALEKFARCIRDLSQLGYNKRLDEVAVIAQSRSWITVCVPKDLRGLPSPPAAKLSCEDVALSFVNQTLDQGTLKLARCFIEMNRKPATAAVLKKHGITPMLRTT